MRASQAASNTGEQRMADDKDGLREDRQHRRDFSRPYRVTSGEKFRLSDVDPGDTAHLTARTSRRRRSARRGRDALAELQDKLYAQDRWSVLLVFQAMDAAGKDGAIKHVMSGVNPQGAR
jgi:polyphosphate kinase 2 (PPK2 family)